MLYIYGMVHLHFHYVSEAFEFPVVLSCLYLIFFLFVALFTYYKLDFYKLQVHFCARAPHPFAWVEKAS